MVKIEYGGFTHEISPWAPFNGGEAYVCRNRVSLNGTEICTVPGVLTKDEYQEQKYSLMKQLRKNLIESGTDFAQMKLGLPPYDTIKAQQKKKLDGF